MKNNFNPPIPKRIAAIKGMILFVLIALLGYHADGQCGGCTARNTNANFTVGPGQISCLNFNNYSGIITLNGGTVCISAGITCNATYVYSAGSTINNSGTMGTAVVIGSGYVLTNSGTVNNTVTINSGGNMSNTGTKSGTTTIATGGIMTSSGTLSGTVTLAGTLTASGTFSAATTVNSAGILTLNTASSAAVTMNAGSAFNNSNSYSGTLTNTGGAITNIGTISTAITVNGTLANSGTINNGLTIASGATATNTGSITNGITINNGGTLNNNNALGSNITMAAGATFNNTNNYTGTITNVNGSIITNSGTINANWTLNGTLTNSGTVSNAITISSTGIMTNTGTINASTTISTGGTLNNNTGGTISGAVSSSGTLTNNNNATISGAISLSSGGDLTNNSSGTLAAAITMSSGSTFSNNRTYTGSLTQNGGAVTNFSGGSFSPSSLTATGGSFTNNVGGTATIPATTFSSGYSLTNNGAITMAAFTINGGASVTLTGTSQTLSAITNNGTLTLAGPATVNGTFGQNSSAIATFSGGITITGTTTNNGTINLTGNLSIGGNYIDNAGATIRASAAGNCNLVNITGTNNSGSGTFNGNGFGMTVATAPTPASRLTGGATGPVAAPILQGTILTTSISALTVSGSFTSPSAAISGYMVLRYIGASAPVDNPTNNTTYVVGTIVGSSTVVAIIPSASLGVRSFTDAIAASACGQTVYYRIFSYNGSIPCELFDLTSPLTGSIAVTVPTATITAGGPTIFCAGGSVTLTASGGASYLWSTGVNTAAISASTAATYTVTVTNTAGCTASTGRAVTVNAVPTPSVNNATICVGGSATLTAAGGGTYLWNTGQNTAAIVVSPGATTSYTVTVTNASTCTASVSGTVTVNPLPTPSVTGGAICSGAPATLTASGGASYLWSTGASGASISTSTAGPYTVTATSAGCTATASGTAIAYTSPSVTAGSNSPVVIGGTINLTSTAAGGTSPYTYSWAGPASYANTTQNPSIPLITGANLGTYNIRVTDNHTCTATAATSVTANSPGGMGAGLALWLKANSLVAVNGASIPTWTNSIGGNNLSQLTPANQPVYYNSSTDYINYYPVVNFNGSNQEMSANSFSGIGTYSQAHIFIVGKSANNTQTCSAIYENQATTAGESGRINIHLPWAGTTYWDAGTCCSNNRLTTSFPASYSNIPKLWSFSKDLSGTANGAQQDIRINGSTAATLGTNTTFTGNNSPFYLGSTGGGNYFNGEIAEVIYYLGASINATSQNQIESYLALKYGITLDQTVAQNYNSSAGTTYWNAATNGTFNKNIFGVGIDNGSVLSQTQSQSINTNILTISNTSGLANGSFLMLSDSGGANSLTTVRGLPNTINTRLNNVWRVSKTGSSNGQIYVFNKSATNFGYYASIASSMTPYMLVDANADGVFESFVSATSSSGSNISFNTSLTDGALITFGFKASIDFGDAYGAPTTVANNGAGHVVTAGVYLGALIDAEVDGVSTSVNSVGDDTIGVADEDGVDFNIGVPTNGQNILQVGITNSIKVTASTAGYLNAWIDYDQDGTYANTSEYALINLPLTAGVNIVSLNIPDSVLYGNTTMRFRFAQNLGDVTGPTGLAPNGEVEDYKVYTTAPLVGPCTNGFQNPSFEMGPYPATYIITNQSNVHYWKTTASDQQIEVWQSGFLGVPSYLGNYFVELNANMPAALYQDVYTTPGTVVLWHFAHRGRGGIDSCNLKIGPPGATVTKKVVGDGTSAWGVYTGSYTVPANQYITRFEFNALYAASGSLSIGNFIDDMYVSTSFDYGDAPNTYGTLKSSNGPFHAMTGNLYLGVNETCDADGQPSAIGTNDAFDDGVTFPAVCNSCTSYTVNISAYNNSGSPATIAGWIDFNKNGVFDATERAFITIPSGAAQQVLTLTFNTTLAMLSPAPNGSLFARFRIANDSTEIINPTGFASSGEVEDYLIPCSSALSLPVPSSNTPVCTRGTLNLSTTTASGAYYFWKGPNGFSVSGSTATKTNIQLVDSGLYRVYSIYANGCETDSAITHVSVMDCYVMVIGAIFDDANGNGLIDGTDVTTSLGQTLYAVVTDNASKVLANTTIAPNGTFTLSNVPANMGSMTLTATTVNYSIGATSTGPNWPASWTGTQGQYGTNNSAGSGTYSTVNSLIPVSSVTANISGMQLGFDRLPTSTSRNYSIAYPTHNGVKQLTAACGMGTLSGVDPEDGTIGTGQKFTITGLAGLNGNSLYYDLNGNGIPDAGEQITGYTTIINFAPSKLLIKFSGAGSTSASFQYGATDAAGNTDPAPVTYLIHWSGALPVKLISFTAVKQNTSESLLQWSTATEIDNDHFEIERSADAQSWDKIGEVKGNGTTSQQHDYSLTDERPLSGTNYYRLKQVDVDGKFEYSSIEEVEFDNISASSATLAIYPNPIAASGTLNIEMSNTDENISTVSMTNAMGQLVYINELPLVQHANLSDLNLPQGLYIVSIHTTNNKTLTTRLVIQ